MRVAVVLVVGSLVLTACPVTPEPVDGGRPDSAVVERDAGVADASRPDAAAAPDAAVAQDAAVVLDAAVLPDAAVVLDAAVVPDAAVGGDAAVTLDAAVPDAAVPGPRCHQDAVVVDGGCGWPGPPLVEGFGAATVGGWQQGHDVVVVTSLLDNGPGSLREALDTAVGPRVIQFEVDGDILLASTLVVPSNVSVDGRGRDVRLVGKGFYLPGSDDVMVLNVTIADVVDDGFDGITIGDPTGGPSQRVVLDHVTFTHSNGGAAYVDEAIAVIFGSSDITLSWLRFVGWEKVLLAGNGDAPANVDGAITLTMHHWLARATGRRHPQARYGQFHLAYSFLDDWRMFSAPFLEPYPESFGAQAQDGARLLVDQVVFRRDVHTYDTLSTARQATRCESAGVLEGRRLTVHPAATSEIQLGVGCAAGQTVALPYVLTEHPDDVDALAGLVPRLESHAGATLQSAMAP